MAMFLLDWSIKTYLGDVAFMKIMLPLPLWVCFAALPAALGPFVHGVEALSIGVLAPVLTLEILGILRWRLMRGVGAGVMAARHAAILSTLCPVSSTRAGEEAWSTSSRAETVSGVFEALTALVFVWTSVISLTFDLLGIDDMDGE